MMITFLEEYETQRKLLKVRVYPCYFLIWIRHSLQASIASTHRHVHVQIVVLGSFLHYS
jgi:hypothetical protein